MVVTAIRCGEQQCGKRVLDSKKRWFWIFNIDDREYMMELIVSFLSGKKRVLVNGVQKYNDQSLLNINLDYVYNVNGNSIMISLRMQNCQMRINNRQFHDLFKNGKEGTMMPKIEPKSNHQKKADPFSQFTNMLIENDKSTEAKVNNDFGEFDMNFNFEKQTVASKRKSLDEKVSIIPINLTNKENVACLNNKQFTFEEDTLFGSNTFDQITQKNTPKMNDSVVASQYYFEPEAPYGLAPCSNANFSKAAPSSPAPTFDLL